MNKPTLPSTDRTRPSRSAPMVAAASVVLFLSGNALAQDGQPLMETTVEAESSALTVDVAELESRIEELRQELATAREEVLARAAQMAGLESENADLQSRLGEGQTLIQSLREEVATQTDRIETITGRVADLEAQLETTDGELSAALESIALKDEQLAGLRSANMDLQSEIDSARNQMSDLRDDVAAKADQIATMATDTSTLRTQLEAVRNELSTAMQDLDSRGEQVSRLESQTIDLRAQLDTARERASELANRAELAEAEMHRTVDDLQGRLATANRELASAKEEKEAVQSAAEQEITALRALLPPDEGGSLDLDAVRERAAQQAETLRETHRALRRGGHVDQEALQQALAQATSDLRKEQILVNRIMKGTLYQVKEGDTLGIISARFYGSANAWPQVFDTNRHVLENADAVVPGTTLILP
jgi:chromosome segregation ATPase